MAVQRAISWKRHRAWVWGGIVAIILPVGIVSALHPGAPAATQPGRATPATTAPATRTAEQKKQDDINRVMEFFRITQPDVYEQARVLRVSDEPKFEKLISGAIPTVNRLELLKRKNSKLFDLSMQDLTLNYRSLRIAVELKRTDLSAGDRKLLDEQLKKIVASEFDVQQQIRQVEIEDLKKRVADLDTQVHGRESDRENIISKRVEDLVERSPGTQW